MGRRTQAERFLEGNMSLCSPWSLFPAQLLSLVFFPASFLPLRKPQMVYFLTQAAQRTLWGCLKLPRPGATLKPALINLVWGPGTCLFRSSPGALFVWSASGTTALIIVFRRVKISYRFPLQGLRTMEEKI